MIAQSHSTDQVTVTSIFPIYATLLSHFYLLSTTSSTGTIEKFSRYFSLLPKYNYVYIGGLNDWWTSLGWKSVMRTSKGERKKAKLAALLSEMILTTSCIQQTAATLFWRLWLESILMLVSGGEEEWCLVCMMSDNQTYTPQRYWCGLLGCIYYGVYGGRGFYSLRLNIIKV